MDPSRHPAAALLVVGDEILAGRTQDTNSHWLAQRLHARGVRLAEVRVVPDGPARIAKAVRGLQALLAEAASPGVLLVVGGLGPTPDDRTLDGVARALDRRLALHPDAERMVRRAHAELARMGVVEADPGEGVLKMARLPGGATPIPNGNGMAPGVRLDAGGVTLYCLPGVPKEMKALFEQAVAANLPAADAFHVEEVPYRGVEEAVYPLLVEMERRHPEVSVGSYPQWGEARVLFRLSGDDAASVKAAADELRGLLAQRRSKVPPRGNRHEPV